MVRKATVVPHSPLSGGHCSGSSPFPRPLGCVFTWDCAEPAEPPTPGTDVAGGGWGAGSAARPGDAQTQGVP